MTDVNMPTTAVGNWVPVQTTFMKKHVLDLLSKGPHDYIELFAGAHMRGQEFIPLLAKMIETDQTVVVRPAGDIPNRFLFEVSSARSLKRAVSPEEGRSIVLRHLRKAE